MRSMIKDEEERVQADREGAVQTFRYSTFQTKLNTAPASMVTRPRSHRCTNDQFVIFIN